MCICCRWVNGCVWVVYIVFAMCVLGDVVGYYTYINNINAKFIILYKYYLKICIPSPTHQLPSSIYTYSKNQERKRKKEKGTKTQHIAHIYSPFRSIIYVIVNIRKSNVGMFIC